MYQIQTLPTTPTMSSREIAVLTEKEHKNVKRDIERMLEELGEDRLKFERIFRDSLNRDQTEYALDRELTETLLTGYNAILRRTVIARWRELEESSTHNRQLSTIEILQIAMHSEQERIRLTAELEAAAPAIAFVDKYVDSTGTKGFRQVCKLLKVKEPEFRTFLSDAKVMYKLGGEWVPYADHIDAGRFQVSAGTADTGHAYNSARFTPKGINWVAGEYAKYQIRGAA